MFQKSLPEQPCTGECSLAHIASIGYPKNEYRSMSKGPYDSFYTLHCVLCHCVIDTASRTRKYQCWKFVKWSILMVLLYSFEKKVRIDWDAMHTNAKARSVNMRVRL